MSVYMTEEEQLEAIKKWWQRNNTWIMLVLSCILLAYSGYKYWNWHVEKVNTQASNTYEHLMIAFSESDNKSVRSYANQLISNYDNTVYADAARLALAKLLVSKNKLDKARAMLEQVVINSKMSALKQVARMRIARLFAAEKSYDQALKELAVVNDSSYMPVINELKGDIFAATGQYQQAITSYKEAISEVRNHGMGNLFLEMKTNELAALAQSVNNADSLVQAA